MMDEAAVRMGRNEALFREVNEAIARGLWPGEDERIIAFRCECARIDCNQPVQLTPAEYRHVRRHPRRFVLRAGHERPEIETVIDARAGYVVVEKEHVAGLVAELTDPRS